MNAPGMPALILPGEWVEEALCAQADPEAFFPEKGGAVRPAQAICARCPVREECLEYALENGERFGMWGGVSERARRQLAKDRGITYDGLKPCGTLAAYRRHIRDGEEPCGLCTAKNTEQSDIARAERRAARARAAA